MMSNVVFCSCKFFHSFSISFSLITWRKQMPVRFFIKYKQPAFRKWKRKYSSQNPKEESSWSIFFYFGAFTVGSIMLIFDRLVSCTAVTGRSMQPTINPDELKSRDWVLLDRRPVRSHCSIERGDIITYKTPRDPDEINIKRVVALEGDVVTTLGYRSRSVRIPAGHCWVEGDNHKASDDSNRTGPIPLGLITGKATAIMFPFSRMQLLSRKFPHSRVKLNPNCSEDKIKHLPTIISPNLYERRT